MKITLKFLPCVAVFLLSFFSTSVNAQIVSKSQLPINLQNGLMAFYPFNGNAGDSSGNGNHGTVNGAIPDNDRFNNQYNSFLFTGSQYIRNPAFMIEGDQLTISLWVKPTNITSNPNYTIIRQEDPVFPLGKGPDWLLAFQNRGTLLSFGLGNSSPKIYDELDVPINSAEYISQWILITAVYDGSKIYLYKNGVKIGEKPKTGIVSLTSKISAIGSTSGTIEEFFDGQIDDVMIYNRALTSSEVGQIYSITNPAALYSGITNLNLSNNSISENLPIGTRIGNFIPVDTLPGDFYTYNFISGAGDADNNKFTIFGSELRTGASFDYETKSSYSILVRAEDPLGFYPPFDKQLTININNVINESVPLFGLIAFYPFNGNYNDESGNGNNGSLNGSVGFVNDRFGNASKAVQFGSGYVTANSSVFNYQRNQSFTVSAWFTKESVGDGGRLLSTECPEGNFRIAAYTNGGYVVAYGDYIVDTIQLNNWNHLVYVYSNRQEKLYINGVLKKSNVDNSVENLNYCVPFTMGAKASSAFDKWFGKGDDIAVYNRGLDSAEVIQLYTANGIICNPSTFNPFQDTMHVCGNNLSLDAGSGFSSYSWSNGEKTQSTRATQSGFYKVNATITQSCSVSDSTYIRFSNYKILQNDTTLNLGQSITLTYIDTTRGSSVGNLPSSAFLWSSGQSTAAITVRPIVSSWYFVSLTYANSTCRDSINVVVQNAFAYDVLPDTIKAFKDSVILDAGSGYNRYSWSDNSSSQTINVKKSGVY